MPEHCVVDLNYPPRLRCQCCGAKEELELPIPLFLAVRMARRFEADHEQCSGGTDD